MRNIKKTGYTLIELLIVLGIFIVIGAIYVQVFQSFQKKTDIDSDAQKIFSVLELAKTKTLSSEQGSQYGVYFDNSIDPNQCVIFKGENYAQREPSFDEIYFLLDKNEIYQIDLGGTSEVVFERLIGSAAQAGSISLRLKSDHNQAKTIYLSNSGAISFSAFPVVSDENRLKDSRHIHFDYGRLIDQATEIITLTFAYDSSTVTQDIVIADNLYGGQIYWQGEINVAGETQKIEIQTLRLNSLDTQFCVHRDRRYNNKALSITLSGDSSGTLLNYSAGGELVVQTSIYASNIVWQ